MRKLLRSGRKLGRQVPEGVSLGRERAFSGRAPQRALSRVFRLLEQHLGLCPQLFGVGAYAFHAKHLLDHVLEHRARDVVCPALTCHNVAMCALDSHEGRVAIVEAAVILEVRDCVCFFSALSAVLLQPIVAEDEPCCRFAVHAAKRPYVHGLGDS